MVTATVEAGVAVEVDEVHQHLVARAAREAGRVPEGVGSGARGEHRHLPAADAIGALQTHSVVRGGGDRSDRSDIINNSMIALSYLQLSTDSWLGAPLPDGVATVIVPIILQLLCADLRVSMPPALRTSLTEKVELGGL